VRRIASGLEQLLGQSLCVNLLNTVSFNCHMAKSEEPPSRDVSTEVTEGNDDQAAADDEQASVQEAVAQSTQTTASTEPTYAEVAASGRESAPEAEDSAAPDAEQASISEAVERSI